MIIEIKNEYESKFYELRNSIDEMKSYMTPEEYTSFVEQFKMIELWI